MAKSARSSPADGGKSRRVSAAFIALVAIGMLIRVWQFGYNRPLWLDEAMLAATIIDRPFVGLVTRPPEYLQRAPAGYLILVKLAERTLGDGEPALRLVSLLSGLATPVLAMLCAPAFFRTATSRLCFVGLVSLSPILIYYSTELKPYETDVAVGLFVVLTVLRHHRWPYGTLWLGLGGALATWISYPSVFVLAGAGSTALVLAWTRRHWVIVRSLGLAIACWIGAFATHWAVSLSSLLRDGRQARMWASGFPPMPPQITTTLSWLVESFAGLVFLSFRQTGLADLPARPQWFDALNVVLMVTVVGGALVLAQRSRPAFFLLTTPAFVALGAAFLGCYPFRNRLLLFLTPFVYAVVSSLIDPLADESRLRWRRPGAVLAIGALIAFLVPSARRVLQPDNREGIKRALAFVAQRRLSGDKIAVGQHTRPGFRYYARRYGLDPSRVATWIPRGSGPASLVNRLRCGGVEGRVWLVFSHEANEARPLIDKLGRTVPRLEAWGGEGASATLFDLSALSPATPQCSAKQRHRPRGRHLPNEGKKRR